MSSPNRMPNFRPSVGLETALQDPATYDRVTAALDQHASADRLHTYPRHRSEDVLADGMTLSLSDDPFDSDNHAAIRQGISFAAAVRHAVYEGRPGNTPLHITDAAPDERISQAADLVDSLRDSDATFADRNPITNELIERYNVHIDPEGRNTALAMAAGRLAMQTAELHDATAALQSADTIPAEWSPEPVFTESTVSEEEWSIFLSSLDDK